MPAGWFNGGRSTTMQTIKPPVPPDPQITQNPPPPSDDKNKTNGQNNTGNNNDMVDNIWNDLEAGVPPNGQNNNQNNNSNTNNNNNQQPPQSDPRAELKAHFESVGIGDFNLTDTDKEALKNGDPAEIFGRINHRIQTAYAKALSNASTIMDAKVEAAVDKAVKTSRSYYQGEQIREMLSDDDGIIGRLSKNTMFQPIVESVFKRYAEKPGSSIPKALEATRLYLTKMHKELDPEYIEPNGNTQSSFNSNNNRQQPRQQKIGPVGENASWLDVLRNK